MDPAATGRAVRGPFSMAKGQWLPAVPMAASTSILRSGQRVQPNSQPLRSYPDWGRVPGASADSQPALGGSEVSRHGSRRRFGLARLVDLDRRSRKWRPQGLLSSPNLVGHTANVRQDAEPSLVRHRRRLRPESSPSRLPPPAHPSNGSDTELEISAALGASARRCERRGGRVRTASGGVDEPSSIKSTPLACPHAGIM